MSMYVLSLSSARGILDPGMRPVTNPKLERKDSGIEPEIPGSNRRTASSMDRFDISYESSGKVSMGPGNWREPTAKDAWIQKLASTRESSSRNMRSTTRTSTTPSWHDVSWTRDFLDSKASDVHGEHEEFFGQAHLLRALASFISLPSDSLQHTRCASAVDDREKNDQKDDVAKRRSFKALQLLTRSQGHFRDTVVQHTDEVALELLLTLQQDSAGQLQHFVTAIRYLMRVSKAKFYKSIFQDNSIEKLLGYGFHPQLMDVVLDILLGGTEGRVQEERGFENKICADIFVFIGNRRLFKRCIGKIMNIGTRADIDLHMEFLHNFLQRTVKHRSELLKHLVTVEELPELLNIFSAILEFAPECLHTLKLLQILFSELRKQCEGINLPLESIETESFQKIVTSLSWMGSVSSRTSNPTANMVGFTLHKAEAMGALAALSELSHKSVQFVPSYAWMVWESVFFCSESTIFYNLFFRIMYIAIRVEFASLQNSILRGQRDFLSLILRHWKIGQEKRPTDSVVYGELIVNLLRLSAEECGEESNVSLYLRDHLEYQRIAPELVQSTTEEVHIPTHRIIGSTTQSVRQQPLIFEYVADGICLGSSYAKLLGFTSPPQETSVNSVSIKGQPNTGHLSKGKPKGLEVCNHPQKRSRTLVQF